MANQAEVKPNYERTAQQYIERSWAAGRDQAERTALLAEAQVLATLALVEATNGQTMAIINARGR